MGSIMVDKWIIYSFLGMFNMSCLILILKYLSGKIPEEVIMFFVMIIASVGFFIHSVVNKSIHLKDMSLNLILILISSGVISYVANLFWLKGLKLAPNPAYAMALFDIRTVLIAIGAYYFFGSEFSMEKGIGIVICCIGARIITL